LTGHHTQFRNLSVAEVLTEFVHETRIHGTKVRGQLFSKTHRQRISRLKVAFRLGQTDLGHDLFVQSLTRRRRVPSKQSGVAIVELRDLETRQLLDPGRQYALVVAGAEKGEESLKMLGNQAQEV
jgi:hypothetical protein